MAAHVSKVNRARGELDRDGIARTALAILDEEGIDALTMRRLADRVGVPTMTLYGSFRNKREVLDAAVTAAVADFAFTRPDGDFREQVRAHARAVRRLLEQHPAIAMLRTREPSFQPAGFRLTEPALQILLDAGFPPDEAVRAFRALFVHTIGSMLLGPRAPTPEERRTARAALHLLPEDEFPAIAATADAMAASISGPELFDYGLERILDGLEARLAELRA